MKRSGRHLTDTQSIIVNTKSGNNERNHHLSSDGVYKDIVIMTPALRKQQKRAQKTDN